MPVHGARDPNRVELISLVRRMPNSITKNMYTRFNVTAQSTWKQSHASMLAA